MFFEMKNKEMKLVEGSVGRRERRKGKKRKKRTAEEGDLPLPVHYPGFE